MQLFVCMFSLLAAAIFSCFKAYMNAESTLVSSTVRRRKPLVPILFHYRKSFGNLQSELVMLSGPSLVIPLTALQHTHLEIMRHYH